MSTGRPFEEADADMGWLEEVMDAEMEALEHLLANYAAFAAYEEEKEEATDGDRG